MDEQLRPPPALESALAHSLPGVLLQLRHLPGPSGIKLWLLSDDTPQRRLDPEVARRVSEVPPYWALCWASGYVLSNYLLEHPEIVRGKVVADFGAGSGVAAIAAAKLGARRSIAIDRDPLALAACRANSEANGASIETATSLESLTSPIDVLLTADIFYEADNLTILDQLRTVAPVWIAADSRRRDLTRFGMARFAVVEATMVPAFGDPQFDTVEIYRYP